MAGSWDEWPPPSRPRRVEGGIKARSRRGQIGEMWWSQRFIAMLEALGMGPRLGRGRAYARAGQVLDLAVAPGTVSARVQGSRARPYRVRIRLDRFPEADWTLVESALAARALYSAKLLSGEMPPTIEEVFASCGLSLFPSSASELELSCSCPDWAVPCKHIAATFYLLAEAFDRDPFLVLAWRGRDRDGLLARLRGLRAAPLPLLDPAPAGRFAVHSVAPPEHYEEAVARAVQRIRAGELEKIVLAREVAVHAPAEHDAAAVFGVLRGAFRSCYVFCAGDGSQSPGAAFVGASPELLVRREGARASTVALAGSTRRSADPAVDDHLGEQLLRSDKDREEQAIVARRIVRALRPHAVWIAAPDEPEVVKVANIQHLATPIRAQLTAPLSAVELAGLLHPTPAVGGEPHAAAAPRIPALEGLDRGWYAGAVGWTDANEDGELCVALRCALLRGREARLYAGVGVVRDSEPAAELAETEVKLGALLPVLSGF
jgi:isochorismate synthase